jgi:hypothetical protein
MAKIKEKFLSQREHKEKRPKENKIYCYVFDSFMSAPCTSAFCSSGTFFQYETEGAKGKKLYKKEINFQKQNCKKGSNPKI